MVRRKPNDSGIPDIRRTWNADARAFEETSPDDPAPLEWTFVPGKIDMGKLATAYGLGKRAMAVYLLLHTASRINRGRGGSWAVIPARELKRFHIDDASKGRIVAELEKAGLIKVEREGRRSLRMKLAGNAPKNA